MTYSSEYTYYIILRRKGRGHEILYNIGSESNLTTIIRLNGKNADRIFKGIIEVLAKQGAVIPSNVSDLEQVYSIREDLGPVVGAYLILTRRARNIKKWNKFFQELLDGHYIGVAKAFSSFLEVAIELSKSLHDKRHSKGYTLSPVVADALSSALKQFVNKIVRHTRDKRT